MINPLEAFFLTLSLLFFLLYLVQFVLFLRHKDPLSTSEEVGISVVVCAHNEYENLKQLLPQLLNQSFPNKEIIIVDDRSHDDSYDFLLSLQPKIKVVRVEHVPDHANGKKYGLTLGIKAASNDRIVFTDADCIPSSTEWLQHIALCFSRNKQFVIGYSQYIKEPGLLNWFIRYETMLTGMLYMTSAKLRTPYMAVGRNLAYRKSLFMDKKGFGKLLKITGGDDDLFVNQYASKGTTSLALNPKSLVYSKPKKHWKEYFRQKKRHLSVGKLYHTGDKIMIGGRMLLLSLFWILFFILVLISGNLYMICGGFALKYLGQGFAMGSFARKSGDKFNFWFLPLLDLWYLTFLAWMGTRASFSKNIKWS